MVDSSKYYRLWVRNGEPGTAWVQVPTFIGLRMTKYVNGIPTFSATVHTRNATLQALLTANRIFRITNLSSTNGKCVKWGYGATTGEAGAAAGSIEIMTGRLSTPAGDEKSDTSQTNSLASVFYVTGSGFAASVDKMRTKSNTFAGVTLAGAITGAVADAIANGFNVNIGWLDATVSAFTFTDQPDSLWKVCLDIARLGDAAADGAGPRFYPYFIEVTHDAAFVPIINLFYPQHVSAGGVGAGGDFSYQTFNPIGGDATHTINVKTDAREYRFIKDRDRIINRCIVRYAGFGTGNTQTNTAVATDATFPERRDAIIYQPLYDAAAAVLLRDTLVNVFKGTSTGLQRSEAVLKSAKLYSGSFTALLGDVVGFQRDSSDLTGTMFDKFLGFEYDQTYEQLKIVVGVPKLPFFDDYMTSQRTIQRAYGAMKQTILARVDGGKSANAATVAPTTKADGQFIQWTIGFGTTGFNVDVDDGLDIVFTYGCNDAQGNVDIDILVVAAAGPNAGLLHERVTTAQTDGCTRTIHISAAALRDLYGMGGAVANITATVVNRSGANRDLFGTVSVEVLQQHFHAV